MRSDDFFSNLEHHFRSNLPFVAYRKPNDSSVNGLLQNTKTLFSTQNFTESGFVFSPFSDSHTTVLMPLEQCKSLSCTLEVEASNNYYQNRVEGIAHNKKQHLNLVQKGIDAIKNAQFQKVVLSRCEIVDVSENQSISVFKRLLQTYSTAFVYCWFHPKVGLWLGATPEILLSVSGSRFKTMALAGTQAFKDSLDVNWATKEQEEQEFVTNYIEAKLKPFVGALKVSEPTTVKAGNLLHLQSNISGTFNTDLQTVLKHLHPTPAVCGLPVKKAKTFILETESYDREYYTGFLGELNLKETTSRNTNRRNVENNAYSSVKTVSHLFVNLRCMQINNNQALIYVGGGITKDSNPEDEWQETVSKAETMKRVLLS